MAVAAVDRETADAGAGDHTARRRQTEHLGLAVEIAPGCPALDTRRAAGRIDRDATHEREIDYQATVVDGVAGDVVGATADGEQQASLPGEVDALDDIGGA